MANWCDIELEIEAATDKDFKRIQDGLEFERKLSCDRRHMMFIGSYQRYLDYVDTDYVNNWITVYGSVRWGIENAEMTDIVRWLQHLGDIKYLKCHIEEGGCQIYGDYEYREGFPPKLTYTYLPCEHYPDYAEEDTEDPDHLVTKLEYAFNKFKVTKEITGW